MTKIPAAVKVSCLRMRCNECITEMHKLNAIVKAGAADFEVSEDHVLFCFSNSVSRNTWQPTTAPPWKKTTSSSARSTWPTATLTCSWWSSTTSLWTAPSTSAWPWGSVTPSRTSSSTRSRGRKSMASKEFLCLPPSYPDSPVTSVSRAWPGWRLTWRTRSGSPSTLSTLSRTTALEWSPSAWTWSTPTSHPCTPWPWTSSGSLRLD